MEKYYSNLGLKGLLANTKIRYGIEPDISYTWKDIAQISNIEDRNKKINELIAKMESNCNNNVFFQGKKKFKLI